MHHDPPSDRRSRDPRYPAGISLIEVVVSMAIMSVLIGAMVSTVFLATKALPDPDSPTFIILDTGRVADDLAEELRYAVTFTQRLPNLVEFTVADRDNDLAPETILYQWSGTPGDPLTRQYNGGTVVNMIDNVQQFSLTYNIKSAVDPTAERPEIEGPEQQFLAQDGDNSGAEATYAISANKKCAQSFQPTLPADATSWRITRATFIGAPGGSANGNLSIEIVTESGNGKPQNSAIDAVLVAEADLVATQWHEVVFPNAGGLDPSKAHFVAMTRASGGSIVGNITIGENSLASPDTHYYADDGGGTYWEDTTKDIWLWVWGTSSTPDLSWVPPTTDYLKTMTITVQSGTNPATAVELETAILNQPVVP